jgi:hypothetical protein
MSWKNPAYTGSNKFHRVLTLGLTDTALRLLRHCVSGSVRPDYLKVEKKVRIEIKLVCNLFNRRRARLDVITDSFNRSVSKKQSRSSRKWWPTNKE